VTNDAPPTITLRIERPGRPDETRTFSAARVLVGRETGDIVLGDPESSALHAEIDCSTGAVVVRDLGSKNGTWRDDARLPQFALFVGQSFRCGATTLTLTASASPLGAVPGRTVLSGDRTVAPTFTPPPLSAAPIPPGRPTMDEIDAATTMPFGTRPSSTGTLPGEQSSAPRPVPSSSSATLPFRPTVGPSSTMPTNIPLPGLGESAPVLHRDTQTGPPDGPTPPSIDATKVGPPEPAELVATGPDVTAIAPPSSTTLVAPLVQPSSGTEIAPLVHRTEPVPPRVHATEPVPPQVHATEPTPTPGLRPPVANALIKPGGNRSGKTGPTPVIAAPRRRPSLALAAKIAGVVALVAALGGAIWWAVVAFGHRAPALASAVARELPDTSLAFVAMASPRTQIELFGDELPTAARDEAKQAFGFDPFALASWEERGVDVDAPVGIALLGVDPPTLAVSFGVRDAAKLRESLPAVIAAATGGTAPTITDRSFGDVQGMWIESPKPTAMLVRDGRLVAIFGAETAEASVVTHHAEKLAKLERGHTLADREGFAELVREPGDPVLFVYVDGISARSAIPIGQAELIGLRMAFAEIDAAAVVLSRDGPRLHLGMQTVVREGSQAQKYVADAQRSGRLLDRVPGPALAVADVAFASEPAIQAMVSMASLAGVWDDVEKEFRAATQLDLRVDVLDNLTGELGGALWRMPSKPGADDFATGAWIGVKDSTKAAAAAAKLVELPNRFGMGVPTVEKVGSTDVHVLTIAGIKIQTFVAHEAVWFAFGSTDAREIVEGPGKNVRTAARTDEMREALEPGGTLAGFFDIRSFLGAIDPLISESDKKEKAELEPILAPLEAITARSETKKRTTWVRLTLHTSGKDALGEMVRSTMKVTGEKFTRQLQRSQRLARCAALAEHLIALGKTDTSRSIPEFELRYDVHDKCVDQASLKAIECALAAKSFAEVARCSEGEVALLPEEAEPIPVPYIDDIWPNTKGEPSDSGRPRADVNYAVDVGPEPQTRGNADALVTIVEFGDFQCPHCRQVSATVDQVLSKHGPEVRVVFRHLPLALHPEAKNAAKAALAAARQEKFWAMHDKLFDRQFELAPDKYRVYAGEIGLDLAKFDTDFADPALDRRIDEDLAVAAKFGATGTPSFFINGRFISGAQPIEVFDALVREEMERARKFVERRGNTRKRLYDDMIARFAPEVLKSAAVAVPHDSGERFTIPTDGLPKKGAASFARITLVECGDFDCPYCQRATKTIDRVLTDYPSQVSFFFAHNPLSFHPTAEAAARAAVAADKQGKFWEMHDKLFAEQDKRTETDFLAFARELKLDEDKFKTDMAAAETAKLVADQRKLCQDNRATGTPSFFVNGRLLEGAQPYETFKAILDKEVAGGI